MFLVVRVRSLCLNLSLSLRLCLFLCVSLSLSLSLGLLCKADKWCERHHGQQSQDHSAFNKPAAGCFSARVRVVVLRCNGRQSAYAAVQRKPRNHVNMKCGFPECVAEGFPFKGEGVQHPPAGGPGVTILATVVFLRSSHHINSQSNREEAPGVCDLGNCRCCWTLTLSWRINSDSSHLGSRPAAKSLAGEGCKPRAGHPKALVCGCIQTKPPDS